MSIKDKQDEQERIQEYIEMEKGKLEEAQKYLQDDQEVFEKMLKESEQKASAAR